ncbi:MAG TPA: hypothetical protein VHM01_17905 [Alphaproteobacteria bacterium]|nr:hypothetical protein [Alphaproteobacteria bacterium]
MTIYTRLIVAAAVLLACAGAEWTDDRDVPGRAASMRFRAIDSGAAMAVRPLDNSPLNIELTAEIAKALRERGITVTDDAPLLLEFETATESSSMHEPQRVLPERPRVDIGRKRDLGRSDAIDAHIDLYSSSRSSVFTGVRRPEMAVRYSLRATLSERSGARLWEGYTEYGDIASDERRLYAAMAPLLASMVGQSTGERRFRAD